MGSLGCGNEKRVVLDNPFFLAGRSTRIRTLDPLLPKQVRYRAAPHSEECNYTRERRSCGRTVASSIMLERRLPAARRGFWPDRDRVPRP